MSKLSTVQKVFKVFGVFAKIGLVVVIIGLVGCIAMFVISRFMYDNILSLDFIIDALDENGVLYTQDALVAASICGIITTAAALIVSIYCVRYIKREQRDGTPFTHAGAAMLRKLGVLEIVFPLVAAIASSIVFTAYNIKQIGKYDVDNGAEVVTGIVLIIAAVIFDYGAELEEKKNAAPPIESALIPADSENKPV